jgi:hypothetical protein
MPVTKAKGGYKWGSKGPFKTKRKAKQVARAAKSAGYKPSKKAKGKKR